MATKINKNGSTTITLTTGQKVAIQVKSGTAIVFYSTFPIANYPETFYEQTRITNTETVLGAFANDRHIRIDAIDDDVYYTVGLTPTVSDEVVKVTRSTVTNAATLTAAQMQSLCVYQDASGGVVTMTTLTGTLTAAVFPDLAIGESVKLYHASNHATNTSTLAGGVDVTLVGSGAVTATGGQYLLIKTAATTFDLVRVG